MKRTMRVIIIIIFFVVYSLCAKQNTVNAAHKESEDPPGTIPTVSGTIKKVTPIDSLDYTDLQKTAGYILGFLQIASALTSVVMIAFTGFKLVVETNPTVLEETKKTMVPIVLGMVMTFGAVSIAKFIIGAVE